MQFIWTFLFTFVHSISTWLNFRFSHVKFSYISRAYLSIKNSFISNQIPYNLKIDCSPNTNQNMEISWGDLSQYLNHFKSPRYLMQLWRIDFYSNLEISQFLVKNKQTWLKKFCETLLIKVLAYLSKLSCQSLVLFS